MKVEQIRVTVSETELRQSYIERFRKMWAGTDDVEIVVDVAGPEKVVASAPVEVSQPKSKKVVRKETTPAEVLAEKLNVHPVTVRRWKREGVLDEKIKVINNGNPPRMAGTKRRDSSQVKFNIMAALRRSGMTTEQFCSAVGIHPSTLYRSAHSGMVPARVVKSLAVFEAAATTTRKVPDAKPAPHKYELSSTHIGRNGEPYKVVSISIRSDGETTYRLQGAGGFTSAMTAEELESYLN